MDASILRELTSDQLKTDLPEFGAGDTVRIHVRVIEGDKERTQIFEGTVIQRKGSGIQETFTVRKISQGIAIERIFPMHSPRIAKIERLREGGCAAPLFYLRGRKGRAARIREKAGAVSGGHAMVPRGDMPFTRKNWSLAIAGLAAIVLGYVFLRIPPAEGFLSLTLAPVFLVVGYCVLIPMAILVRDQSADEGEEAERT